MSARVWVELAVVRAQRPGYEWRNVQVVFEHDDFARVARADSAHVGEKQIGESVGMLGYPSMNDDERERAVAEATSVLVDVAARHVVQR